MLRGWEPSPHARTNANRVGVGLDRAKLVQMASAPILRILIRREGLGRPNANHRPDSWQLDQPAALAVGHLLRHMQQ